VMYAVSLRLGKEWRRFCATYLTLQDAVSGLLCALSEVALGAAVDLRLSG
jgi:hypothetical protein